MKIKNPSAAVIAIQLIDYDMQVQVSISFAGYRNVAQADLRGKSNDWRNPGPLGSLSDAERRTTIQDATNALNWRFWRHIGAM